MYIKEEMKNCFGCTACVVACPQNCISMEFDCKGFRYPVINKRKCLNCGVCKQVCQQNISKKMLCKTPRHIYGVKHIDEQIRKRSASGGMFTAISDYIIEQEGVVVGATMGNDFEVYHDFADTKEEGRKFCGSKYVQSNLKDVYRKIKQELNSGRLILFVGTPCQVSGLKMYLKKEYDTLILCNIICHGIMSYTMYMDFVKSLNRSGTLTNIQFRDKEKGWMQQKWSCEYVSGKKKFDSNELIAYKTLYYSGMAHRECCYSCPYASYERPGDFTMGDFWGIEEHYSSFYDNFGISLVFTHTEKADDIFNTIKNRIEYIEVEREKCKQPNLLKPTTKSSLYDKFWNDYISKGYAYVVHKYTVTTFDKKIIEKAKNIVKKTCNK